LQELLETSVNIHSARKICIYPKK